MTEQEWINWLIRNFPPNVRGYARHEADGAVYVEGVVLLHQLARRLMDATKEK